MNLKLEDLSWVRRLPNQTESVTWTLDKLAAARLKITELENSIAGQRDIIMGLNTALRRMLKSGVWTAAEIAAARAKGAEATNEN